MWHCGSMVCELVYVRSFAFILFKATDTTDNTDNIDNTDNTYNTDNTGNIDNTDIIEHATNYL